MSWLGILRLGLVQAALGALVVLATSTMNRVMVVELRLPALLPGALVALHYALQVLRPRFGFGADCGGRPARWITGGMAVLVIGTLGAAAAIGLMAHAAAAGVALAVASYTLIGLGVGAAGTSVLVLLAARVAQARRGAAASAVWVMMIAGIAVTATLAGRLLEPYSPARLLAVTAGVGGIAMLLTLLAVWRITGPAAAPSRPVADVPFLQTLRGIWAEPNARRFAVFVFVSMFAYSAQELILEPFAGAVFHLSPGETTQLTGLQHGGVLLGMLLVAVATSLGGGMRGWTVGGCVGSALAVLGVAAAAFVGPAWPLRPALFLLGVANGAFAVSAIGAMMGLAHAGGGARAGTRMGLWGAAQAVAFGLGGLAGSSSSDLARAVLGTPTAAYTFVFALEAALFLLAAAQAARVFGPSQPTTRRPAGVPLPHGG